METISVGLGERSYEIMIETGMFRSGAWARHILALAHPGERIVAVSDQNVWGLYGTAFLSALPEAVPVLTEAGEEHKTLATLGAIFDAFADSGLGRGGLVVAFGGGVAGDVAGFAAACWMRGVRCVQIPTTLLAMADSSVGGKTAVDIPAGKNLVGAFHQPSLVLVDHEFLSTLPAREYASGMAEVVKYGAIASETLFSRIEDELPGAAGMAQRSVCPEAAALCARRPSERLDSGRRPMSPDVATGHNAPTTGLPAILADCIRVKRDIVEEDEREGGRRKLLNFGHTFGHAIEVKYGFSKYTHGQAVAAGMRIAARFGERLGVTRPGTEARLRELLACYDLDIDESALGLVEHMRHDKKAAGDGVSLILLWGIGKAAVCEMDFEKIGTLLADL